MHVPLGALASSHLNSALCRHGVERRQRWLAAEEAALAREVRFSVKGVPLEQVPEFRYLGRLLSSTDDDWPTIYSNLSKARKRWGMVARVLTREGAAPRTSAIFYTAIVQSTLLYGVETWDASPKVFKALAGFHHRVARRLSGRSPRYIRRTAEWVYPPIEEALAATRLATIESSVTARQNLLVDRIATRPILELCKEAERLPGATRRRFWWERVASTVEE